MEEHDPALASRYPFTSLGERLIESEGLTEKDLAYDPLLEQSRRHARGRLLSAVGGGLYLDDLYLPPLDAVATYLIVRLVSSWIGDPFLNRLVAEHESKRFHRLARDEPIHVLAWLGGELGAAIRLDGERAWIDISSYLRAAAGLGGPRWRLANRDVRSGQVLVGRRELARLLQELLRTHLLEPTPRPSLSPPLRAIGTEVTRRLEERKSSIQSSRPSRQALPPCIERLVEKAERGENMSHQERFTLAAYLLRVGWSVDRVVDLFRSAPDFKERVARYQVSHIAKGGYNPPNCETLRSWGICVEDCGVKSPLSYGRRGRRRR